jgi:hypothetical protein
LHKKSNNSGCENTDYEMKTGENPRSQTDVHTNGVIMKTIAIVQGAYWS